MAKVLTGKVTSKSGDKSLVITVARRVVHPLYKKNYSVSARFAAHDEKSEGQVGDTVSIIESRPISKTKRFKLLKVLERPAIREEDKIDALASPVENLPAKQVKPNISKKPEQKALATEDEKDKA